MTRFLLLLLLSLFFTLSLHFTPGLQSAVCILHRLQTNKQRKKKKKKTSLLPQHQECQSDKQKDIRGNGLWSNGLLTNDMHVVLDRYMFKGHSAFLNELLLQTITYCIWQIACSYKLVTTMYMYMSSTNFTSPSVLDPTWQRNVDNEIWADRVSWGYLIRKVKGRYM